LVADLTPSKLARLAGTERFSAGDASVLDFWRWALGDLRMNTVRGYLAEFLVARALCSPDPTRIEWAAHDVTAADGTRVEVKSSGCLQSWGQRAPSAPRWGLTGAKLVWNPASGSYEHDPAGRADVWVFALHTCADRDVYDPLDVGQWRWWATPDAAVEHCGQKTAGIATIERLAGQPVPCELLEGVVAAAAGMQSGARA
jgi:hypothetical protein